MGSRVARQASIRTLQLATRNPQLATQKRSCLTSNISHHTSHIERWLATPPWDVAAAAAAATPKTCLPGLSGPPSRGSGSLPSSASDPHSNGCLKNEKSGNWGDHLAMARVCGPAIEEPFSAEPASASMSAAYKLTLHARSDRGAKLEAASSFF